MKKKHKILLFALISAVVLISGAMVAMSQWQFWDYSLVNLSTEQVSPRGRYERISARRYYDIEDATTLDTNPNKKCLDPGGESFVEILRTVSQSLVPAVPGEIGCSEISGVTPGTRTRTTRFIRFHPTFDAFLSNMRIENDLFVGGSYNYDGSSNGSVDIGFLHPRIAYPSGNFAGPAIYGGGITCPGYIEMGVPTGAWQKHVYDIAEGIETIGSVKSADVVIIDPDYKDKVRVTDIAYDPRVAGVISEEPAIYLASGENRLPLSLKGKAYCKATADNGAIRLGDLLVTAGKKGYAMRADLKKIKPGMVIGKALEGLETGEGKILIWVSPG